MPRTPQSVAQEEHYHLILTVWASSEHRRLGGNSWRAATGVLSADGSALEVTDRTGTTYLYPLGLDPSLSASVLLSTVGQSVAVTIAWDRETQLPGDVDLRNAVGELALINETGGGTGVEAWERRRQLVEGRVSGLTWGTSRESLSFSLAGGEMVDSGDIYGPGAELTTARFADIANTGDRDRAHNADGLLPPVVYAPVGSALLVPCLCVVDEDDAAGGVANLVPRRWLMSYRLPTNTTANEQFVAVSPDDDNRILWSFVDIIGLKTPVAGQDALGSAYWYVPGDFVFTFGTGTVTLAGPVPGPASDIMTASRTNGWVRKGWQVRGTLDAADDYLVVLSADGTTFELGNSAGAPVVYTGLSVTGGQGYSIPLSPNRADGLYWIPRLGGVAGVNGPVSQVVDVVIDLLRFSRFDVPVAFGDLEAMRQRLNGLHISWVCRERMAPWSKVLEMLQVLPIRPYLSEGALRFAWTGPVTEQEIVTTIDLTTLGAAWRLQPVGWHDDPVYPSIRLTSWWDSWREKYLKTLQIDGSRGSYSDASRVPTGRSNRAYHSWRDTHGVAIPGRVPCFELEADYLEKTHGAGLAALWLSYRWSSPRQMMTLDGDGSLRYIVPGDAIRVIESDRATRSQVWRVEGVTYTGAGGVSLLLETIN